MYATPLISLNTTERSHLQRAGSGGSIYMNLFKEQNEAEVLTSEWGLTALG